MKFNVKWVTFDILLIALDIWIVPFSPRLLFLINNHNNKWIFILDWYIFNYLKFKVKWVTFDILLIALDIWIVPNSPRLLFLFNYHNINEH